MSKLKILSSSFILLSFMLNNLYNIKSPICYIKKISEEKNFVSYKDENEHKLSHKCCKDKNEKNKNEKNKKQNLLFFDYFVSHSSAHSDCCSYNKTCCLNFSSHCTLHQKEFFQDLHSESLGLVSEISKEILSIKDKFQPPRQL
jgi:hypothetical protein